MGHKRSLIDGLLAEKDEKIAVLEHRIQGYVGRLSVLQSRLLATLDSLDVMQNYHAQELGDAVRNQTNIREQLDECIKVVKAVEVERDDMRDAVLKLVEKVEASNGYNTWPYSQIRLSSLADPIAVMEGIPGRAVGEEELISYASALIESLRRERDNERRAHTQTRKNTAARILALEAKVSLREAELEACVEKLHPKKEAVREETTPQGKARVVDLKNDSVIPSDQIILILDDTVARNKLLEEEISKLYRRLENARAEASEKLFDYLPPQFNFEPVSKPKVSSQLDSSTSSTTNIVSPISLNLGNQSTPTNVYHERLLNGLDHDILRGLEEQIKLLSEKIDSFADERKILLQTMSLNRTLEPNSHENLETRLRILENECLGLKASQNAHRDELKATRAYANARENDFLDALNSLHLALSSEPLQKNEPRTHQTQHEDNLLIPVDDGEISMELATPLLPLTTICPASPPASNGPKCTSPTPIVEGSYEGGDQRSPYADPPSIPLPSSPDEDDEHFDADADTYHADSPTLSHIVVPMFGNEASRNLYRATSTFVAELRQVENELTDAHAELNVGDTALDQTEVLVHDLHPP